MSGAPADEIEEFEDSEEPGVHPDESLGVAEADEEEIKFLDGLSELASLQSGELGCVYCRDHCLHTEFNCTLHHQIIMACMM
jgi:hypothetical protein